jgi:hypothetical protein
MSMYHIADPTDFESDHALAPQANPHVTYAEELPHAR